MLLTTRNKYVSKKNSKMREKNIIYRKEFWQKLYGLTLEHYYMNIVNIMVKGK